MDFPHLYCLLAGALLGSWLTDLLRDDRLFRGKNNAMV